MLITNEEKVIYTAGAAGTITMLFKFWKIFMQSMRSEKVEKAVTKSDVSSYDRLEKEIARLEETIAQQHLRIARMEEKLNENRRNELADVAAIAVMGVLLDTFPCGRCDNPVDVFGEVKQILAEMSDRRR